jgi:hypothetical protein
MSSEPPALRASHEDRDRVAEALRVAAGNGLITAEELDTRLEAALTARTLDELVPLTADLPAAAPSGPTAADVLEITQAGGKYQKVGRWTLPRRIAVQSGLTRITLDLTEAVLTGDVLDIHAEMAHGRLTIVTTADMVVENNGLALTFSKTKLVPPASGTPRLRVRVTGSLVHAKLVEKRR